MENNDSRLVHIPKQDFVRVMRAIVSGGGEGRSAADILLERARGQEEDEFETHEFEPSKRDRRRQLAKPGKDMSAESPRTAATLLAQTDSAPSLTSRKKRGAAVKSDSLYFLQKSMMEREALLREAVQQQYAASTKHVYQKDSESAIISDIDDHVSLES